MSTSKSSDELIEQLSPIVKPVGMLDEYAYIGALKIIVEVLA